MTDAEDKVREAAASALGQIVDPRAVPALVMALGDRSSGVRENAAQSLGLISDPRATEALVTAMRDDGSNVRFWAAVSLSSVDSPGAVEALLSAVTDKKDKSVRVVAAFALAIRKRPEAVPPLAAVLKSKSDWEAFGAVVGLGLVDSPEAQEALATVAGAPVSPAVRRLASRALQMPILTAMAKELREEDRELHYNICRAFVYLRDPASLPALEEALNSPDSDVRQAARKAIRQVRRTSQPQASSAPA
jgi:HEAT repeat protein